MLRFPSPESARAEDSKRDEQPFQQTDSSNASADAEESDDSRQSQDSVERDEAIEGTVGAPLVADPQNLSILRDERRDLSKRGTEGSGSGKNDRSSQPRSKLESDQTQGQTAQGGLESHNTSSPTADLDASSKGEQTLKVAVDHAEMTPKSDEALVERANLIGSEVQAVKAVTDTHDASDRSQVVWNSDDRSRLEGRIRHDGNVAGEDDQALSNPIASKDAAPESSRSRRRIDRTNSRTRIGGGHADNESVAGERPERANHGRSDVQSASAMTHQAPEQAKGENASLSIPITTNAGMTSVQSIIPSTSVVPSTVPPNTTGTAFNPSTTNKTRTAVSSAGTDAWSGTNATTLSSPAMTSPTSDVRSNPGASGATGTSLSRYQETKLVQRVLRGMEQLANGGGQVRLRLHPPELGALQMSLRIEGQVMTAEMQVETSGARDALMKNLPVLKERLAEQGILVEHFDVRTESSSTTPGGSGASSGENPQRNESQSERGESRSRENANGRQLKDAIGSEPVHDIAKRWTRTNGLIDVEA
jgi:flagellar hook-length control protein FliK